MSIFKDNQVVLSVTIISRLVSASKSQ